MSFETFSIIYVKTLTNCIPANVVRTKLINFALITLALAAFTGCSKDKRSEDAITTSAVNEINLFLLKGNNEHLTSKQRSDYTDVALSKIYTLQNDSLKALFLFKAANRYFNCNALLKYKVVSQRVLQLSNKLEDRMSSAKANSYLGDYFFNAKTNLDSAYYYYIKAEKIYKSFDDSKNLAELSVMKANVLWYEHDYFGSESAALDALKYLRKIDDKQKEFETVILLGMISSELYDYHISLAYLNQSLKIAEDNNLSGQQIPIALNNIGSLYQNLYQYQNSINYFQRALAEKQLSKTNPKLYAVLIDNLAYSKLKTGGNERAIYNSFLLSLKIKKQYRDDFSMLRTESHLAEYFYLLGDTIKAVNILKNAIRISNDSNSIELTVPLKQLITYDKKNGLSYSLRLIDINDRLNITDRLVRNKFARIQFETEELAAEKYKAVQQKWLTVGIALLSLLSFSLLFVIKLQRSKTKELRLVQEQQKSDAEIYRLMHTQQRKIDEGRQIEKRRIARDLHDGVMNMLTSIRLNLFILYKQSDAETIRKCLPYISEIQSVEKEIRNIAHNLNIEAFNNRESFAAVLESLFGDQVQNFNIPCAITIDPNIEWKKINITSKVHIYRMIQESLQNINKHSYAKNITFNVFSHLNFIILEISDDGIGFNMESKNNGIGIKNIHDRMILLGGQVHIFSGSGKGTVIKLLIPK